MSKLLELAVELLREGAKQEGNLSDDDLKTFDKVVSETTSRGTLRVALVSETLNRYYEIEIEIDLFD